MIIIYFSEGPEGKHKIVRKATPMDDNKREHEVIRGYLKALLLRLAAQSDNPATDLQDILREVIEELYSEVKDTIRKKTHLQLVPNEEVGA